MTDEVKAVEGDVPGERMPAVQITNLQPDRVEFTVSDIDAGLANALRR
jgi:hypothetical protein